MLGRREGVGGSELGSDLEQDPDPWKILRIGIWQMTRIRIPHTDLEV